jgi:hypothetical protein
MSDERRRDVIGSLPSTRPHRRSEKRGPAGEGTGKPAAEKAAAKKPAAKKPAAKKPAARKPAARKPPVNVRTRTPGAPAEPPPRRSEPAPAEHHGTLETVVLAAAELTEIGLRAGARALRDVVARLPRP